jgi:AcrR family transcriptional regulator
MEIGISFKLNESLFVRDPQETELGKRIIKHSILMIDEMGFEAFTFKKLAAEIGSVEKSIYRYFDSKHLLLLFLTSWYWEWVHYLIRMNIKNITDSKIKLNKAIENIVLAKAENPINPEINESVLHRVIINEGAKSYHTYAVDKENKAGLFFSYKALVTTISDMIIEINPAFPYSKSLSSNIFEMANNQVFFAEHLPKMTNLENNDSKEKELIKMLQFFTDKLLS